MSVDTSNVQALAQSRLAAAAAFAGLGIFCELDEEATPAELAAIDSQFETALLTTGVAVIILSPQLATLDQVKGSGLSASLVVPVGICENPQVNRGVADPAAVPARSPANKSARKLLEAAIAALLVDFEFPPQPAGRPEFYGGFVCYYLLAQRRHVIRGTA